MLTRSPCDIDDPDLLRSLWFLIAVRFLHWFLILYLFIIFQVTNSSRSNHLWFVFVFGLIEIQPWIERSFESVCPFGQMVPAGWQSPCALATPHLHASSVYDTLGLWRQRDRTLHGLVHGTTTQEKDWSMAVSSFSTFYNNTHPLKDKSCKRFPLFVFVVVMVVVGSFWPVRFSCGWRTKRTTWSLNEP